MAEIATEPDHCDLCGCEMKHRRTGTPDLLVCDACRVPGLQRRVSHLEVGIAK